MDWNFLKKLLRLCLGLLVAVGGIVLVVLSFSGGFEITLAFLAFLLLCFGVYTTLLGIHSLRAND